MRRRLSVVVKSLVAMMIDFVSCQCRGLSGKDFRKSDVMDFSKGKSTNNSLGFASVLGSHSDRLGPYFENRLVLCWVCTFCSFYRVYRKFAIEWFNA